MGAITQCCIESSNEVKKDRNGMPAVNKRLVHQDSCASASKIPQMDELSISTRSKESHRHLQNLQDQASLSESVHLKASQEDLEQLTLKDFEIVGNLGSGTFGTVYLVQFRHKGTAARRGKYAMKCIKMSDIKTKRMEENARFQKYLLETLDHPFLTSLRYTFTDSRCAYLVMECGTGGPMDSFLTLNSSERNRKNYRALHFRKIGEEAVRFVSANVVLGLEELHRHNIMYRDLKPENVIVFDDGYAKLADFGISKFLSPTEVTNTEAGTILYMAPEVVLKRSYTNAIDFWALGVFLFELSTSQSPFKQSEIMQRHKFKDIVKMMEKNRDWKGQSLSSELKDIINKLLRFEPQERLGYKGFQEIKSHPFFKNINWAKLATKKYESPLLPILKQHPLKVPQTIYNHTPAHHKCSISDSEDDELYNSVCSYNG